MGVTYVPVTVKGASGRRVRVRMLVDSGASYALLPEKIWKRLKLKPVRRENFELADGRAISRNVSECHVTLGQAFGHTPVILGEAGDDEPLLGAITLENLGLVLDPFSRRLLPMRLLLYRQAAHGSGGTTD